LGKKASIDRAPFPWWGELLLGVSFLVFFGRGKVNNELILSHQPELLAGQVFDDFRIVAQSRDLLIKETVLLFEGLILSHELMIFTVEFSPLKEPVRIHGQENRGPREEGKAKDK
jgi:hypothetical protein